MRAAVIGHVEWIDFIRVEAVPRPGEIIHASKAWSEAAGGGAVAAVQLANLGCETTFFTALGDDELGRRSARRARGEGPAAPCVVASPSRSGAASPTSTTPGERTITVIGDKHRPRGGDGSLPWEELLETDCVYFTGGDVESFTKARHARVLVATARELPTLVRSGVELDALVASATDAGERYEAGDLDPPPRLFVATSGPLGGWAQPGGPFAAATRRGRSRTPTAPATASLPASRSRSAAATSRATRWPSRRNAARP